MRGINEIQDLIEDTFGELKFNDIEGAKRYFLKIEPLLSASPQQVKASYIRTVSAFDQVLTTEELRCHVGLFADELLRRCIDKV